jgi:hypothetical protein
VLQLLRGVLLELVGNTHIFGALQNLGIDDIGDDGLIFARKIFVQQLSKIFAGHFRLMLGHLSQHFWDGNSNQRRELIRVPSDLTTLAVKVQGSGDPKDGPPTILRRYATSQATAARWLANICSVSVLSNNMGHVMQRCALAIAHCRITQQFLEARDRGGVGGELLWSGIP